MSRGKEGDSPIISGGRNHEGDDEPTEPSMEELYKKAAVPPWTEQITVRSIVTSLLLSVVFCFIVIKLNLSTGVIPSLNVAAGLLGFAIIKSYTAFLEKCGWLKQPFTRQENTVIQTCVVASSGIAFSSGTASYLLAMTSRIASQSDAGNTPNNIKNLSVGWMIGFLFLVSFVGLFSVVPLRKIMILKYKLTYPSGTATAYLINSFHTPKGAKTAKKQVKTLLYAFCGSFTSALFQWFFTGGDDCGFASFPTFGLNAYSKRFYFDFSSTYVGVGMICPYIVNISLLIGAIISWGIMWPLIEKQEGNWYPAQLKPNNLHGIQGYKVFLAIAMMFGDGLFHVASMVIMTVLNLCKAYKANKKNNNDDVFKNNEDGWLEDNQDEQRRKEYFLKDGIPGWFAAAGYTVLAVICICVAPQIFDGLKWYHILVAYLMAPILAFCNAYGCGLTDWSLASNYGKIAIIIFSAWAGMDHGGIIAGLASCGIMLSIVSTAADLMQDFKTGYLTLSSPRSMFCSQVLGTAMGCLISPLVFWFFFYKPYPTVGELGSSYPAPSGSLFRGIALLGVEGTKSLPEHCLTLSICFFVGAIAINIVQEVLKRYNCRAHKFIPSPMCMAIPFYLGGYFTIDMCLGSLILFVWERVNKQKANELAPAVASGMICGDSLWGMPAAVLSMAGANPPICMKFLSAATNTKVDAFLG